MSRPLTLALVQMEPTLGDVEANLSRIDRLTEEASGRGASLVIFPELALTGYNQELLGKRLFTLACLNEDEPIQRLVDTARRFKVDLFVGYIQKGETPEVIYNSLVWIGPDGAIRGNYSKSHLYPPEKRFFRPGTLPEIFRTKDGAVGPMICMDIGFPEVARILSLQGAELLVAPSAWIEEDQDIWQLSLQSRALDNIAFVAGINRVGTEGDIHYIGRSMLIDPRGAVIAELNDEEGILVATIDLDELGPARQRAPRFAGRHPDLYGLISDSGPNPAG